MATQWWVTRAHPDPRPRCQTDVRIASGPIGCVAPSWPDTGNALCRSGCPNHRQWRHPHRTRRWAWIARVALQWRCSCSCLESGLCSYKKRLIVLSISISIVFFYDIAICCCFVVGAVVVFVFCIASCCLPCEVKGESSCVS